MFTHVRTGIPLLIRGSATSLGDLHTPLSDLSDHVAAAMRAGLHPDDIPDPYRALAALGRYVGVVDGHGHDFVHEMLGDDFDRTMADAEAGATLLNLPAFGALARAYRDLIGTVDLEAIRNDPAARRVLFATCESLDDQMAARRLDPESLTALKAACPSAFRAEYEAHLANDSIGSRNPVYPTSYVWIATHPDLEVFDGSDTAYHSARAALWDQIANYGPD